MKRILATVLVWLILITISYADYITQERTQIYNQGNSSTCVAYSIKTIIEMQTGEKVNYRDIYNLRNKGQTGMYIDDTLCKLGIEYSKLTANTDYIECSVKKGKIVNKKTLYKSINTEKNVKKVQQALTDRDSVIIDIQMDKSIYNVRKNGILNKYNRLKNEYHAMVIIGWKTIDDKEYWIVQNSWGKHWGDSGICYVPFDYPLIRNYYTIKRGADIESVLRFKI
jgi:C1A family cysteine protease